ncbi:unnamed protein product (macronuclear) [Paramecium tetraurelia]|uniref:Transmembrane protein n=1 Tax=Paramecium tetraurelia TaxID=5888 RepID=A0CF16_PARTE|nr:uncharacterized protein GSPATT00037822001 [Paramecium tetraurelia]CAK69383.1 unnamed protein product [Paramecium tetraurelia]|eukprot:XP_001436780.1 hypothetical protein (macronuclear) [Paramecium tetraurelia strain d4-2]
MKILVVLLYLALISLAYEDSPGESSPLQVEVQIFGNSEQTKDEEVGIFQFDEFKRGTGSINQLFIKDLLETISAAFESIANNEDDATFLQDAQKLPPQQDGLEPIQVESPIFGFFNPFISMFQPSEISDFVEIETISINGQKQTKVTKTQTRNGITTTTTEITRESIQNTNNNQLSDEFLLQENSVVEEGEKFFGSEEDVYGDNINLVNLDDLESVKDFHLVQDNYVNNELVMNGEEKQFLQLPLGLSIFGGLVLTLLIGYSIKKFVFKNNQ